MTTIQARQGQIKSLREANAHNLASCRTQLMSEEEALKKCQIALDGAMRARDVLNERLPDLYENMMRQRTT